MLSTLRNAWKVPDLRRKFLWTIALVAIFRIGTHLPVPGISTEYLKEISTSGSLFGLMDLISGGAFSNFSIFALGVSPYINASIIVQLLTIAIPSLESMSKEGEEGRKKIQSITRVLSIFIGFLLSFTVLQSIRSANVAAADITSAQTAIILISLVVGSTFAMWLGDQITVKGFGNGVSILIFVNIVSRLPMSVLTLWNLKDTGEIGIIEIGLFVAFALASLAAVVYFSLAERRIPVQYAGKAVGSKVMKQQSSHIPLSIIGSTVIAIIFSMSVMSFPTTLAQIFPTKEWAKWILGNPTCFMNPKSWMYLVLYAIMTIFFTYFYTQITFKPDEMAENLNKSAGFVPGIRPGEETERYFERVLTRISMISGVFAAVVAITPLVLSNYTKLGQISFFGTSLLIMVSVGLEFSKRLDSQLVMRHYQGFLK